MRGLLDPGSFGPASRLYGGRLFRISGPGSGIGDNEPPPDAEEIPEAEPTLDAPRVPQGWDIPGHVTGGLEHPPVLSDGTTWPVATHDQIKTLLAPQGRHLPSVTILIPYDGVGPLLLGSTGKDQFEQPKGYDAVMFFGTPQTIYVKDLQNGRIQNGHADDSIQEALRLAQTHQFSMICFNRGYSMVTNGMVQSLRRPDVFAVARPQFSNPYGHYPYESFSGTQTAKERRKELPNVSDIVPISGRGPSQ